MPTPDGIADADWNEIEQLARAVAEAAITDDSLLYASAVDELQKRLAKLQSRYGPLPSILATMADFTENDRDAIHMLETAFFAAKERDDTRNMTYIASSIAQRYVEDLSDLASGQDWVDVLRRCLVSFPDETEFKVLAELEAQLSRGAR